MPIFLRQSGSGSTPSDRRRGYGADRPLHWVGASGWALPPRARADPRERRADLADSLDAGEAAAIALASEHPGCVGAHTGPFERRPPTSGRLKGRTRKAGNIRSRCAASPRCDGR